MPSRHQRINPRDGAFWGEQLNKADGGNDPTVGISLVRETRPEASLGGKAWFNLLVTLVGMLAGFYVSVYSSEIKGGLRAFVNLPWLQLPDWGHLLVAVVATLVFGSCLNANLSAQRDRAEEAKSDAAEQQRRLLDQLGTQRAETREAQQFAKSQGEALQLKLNDVLSIPPRGFLSLFREFATDVGLLAFTPSADTEFFDDRVRIILYAIASLAQQYDESDSSVEYTACYYLYHSKHALEKMPVATRAQILRHLQLTENNDAGLSGMAGLLELRDGMSVSVKDGKTSRPSGIEALTLGVAEHASHAESFGGRSVSSVLPGAPWSVAMGDFYVAPTIESAAKWLSDQADFTKRVKNEFQRYFSQGPGRSVKSFASLPIVLPERLPNAQTPRDTDEEAIDEHRGAQIVRDPVVGVLTIHSSAPGILRSSSSRTDIARDVFIPLLQPFLTALVVETVSARRLLPSSPISGHEPS
jgi:hypothetical protein